MCGVVLRLELCCKTEINKCGAVSYKIIILLNAWAMHIARHFVCGTIFGPSWRAGKITVHPTPFRLHVCVWVYANEFWNASRKANATRNEFLILLHTFSGPVVVIIIVHRERNTVVGWGMVNAYHVFTYNRKPTQTSWILFAFIFAQYIIIFFPLSGCSEQKMYEK